MHQSQSMRQSQPQSRRLRDRVGRVQSAKASSPLIHPRVPSQLDNHGDKATTAAKASQASNGTTATTATRETEEARRKTNQGIRVSIYLSIRKRVSNHITSSDRKDVNNQGRRGGGGGRAGQGAGQQSSSTAQRHRQHHNNRQHTHKRAHLRGWMADEVV